MKRGEESIGMKRVYDSPEAADGKRFLAERLWPRGVKKADLKIDGWLKEVAPSSELRKWFSHDPEKWEEFQRRYRKELEAHSEAWEEISEAAGKGNVTLLFSSRDAEHNNVVVLREFLKEKLG